MIEQEFVPYAETLALKELGFDELCLGYYTIYSDGEVKFFTSDKGFRNLEAPTFSQAFRWFRDKRGLVSWISFRIDWKKKYLWYITDVKNIAARDGDYIFDILIESYEEAELACLKKLIEIANEQQIRKIS